MGLSTMSARHSSRLCCLCVYTLARLLLLGGPNVAFTSAFQAATHAPRSAFFRHNPRTVNVDMPPVIPDRTFGRLPFIQSAFQLYSSGGFSSMPEFSVQDAEGGRNDDVSTTTNAPTTTASMDDAPALISQMELSVSTATASAEMETTSNDNDQDNRSVHSSTSTSGTSTNMVNSKIKVQYAALEPGTVVQIQVGDVSRARKAWKKRRRTDSPLLVPCSVLNVDLASTVRWNLIYLLEKFGQPYNGRQQDYKQSKEQQQQRTGTESLTKSAQRSAGGGGGGPGIRISLPELSRRSRTHLKASLREHAATLGYANVGSLVKGLFRKPVQDAYGVKLIVIDVADDDDDIDSDEYEQEFNDTDDVTAEQRPREQIWLESPLSRTRAQSRASEAAILQFFSGDSMSLQSPAAEATAAQSNNNAAPVQPTDTLQHTGVVRNKRPQSTTGSSGGDSDSDVSRAKSKTANLYQLKPLSAALRVNQEDVDQGVIAMGSLHAAVVFDYDPLGDAGVAPLLTLSLNPQRNQVRDRLKLKQASASTGANALSTTPMAPEAVLYKFQELHVGDGPIPGKVVKLIKGGALVDCGVGRTTSASSATAESSACLPVYGLLRFKDAVLNRNGADSSSDAAARISYSQASFSMGEMDDDDDMDDDDMDDDDEDWDTIFSIDDLDSLNEDEDEDDDEMDEANASDESAEDEDDDDEEFDEEVLAEFNLENDDEFAEGEDITHLFELYDDGRLAYTDPETGEVTVISDIDLSDEIVHEDDDDDAEENEVDDGAVVGFDDDDEDEEEDMDYDDDEEEEEEEDEDGPMLLGRFATNAALSSSATSLPVGPYKTQTLRPGDRIDVFVKSVSKQSSQLLLTMDSSIQGKTAKDVKKESEVGKKLSRLAKQVGGFQRIRELTGVECDGIVKAVSNAGDWFYVQPEMEHVPVGVATMQQPDDWIVGQSTNTEPLLQVGDVVRIQINGIDEDRGQLAMQILKKLPSR